MIVIYTSGAACIQCELTKRAMDAAGLEYAEVNLADPDNAVLREYVTHELGHFAAPVVVADAGEHWAGFQPDRIRAVASRLEAPTRFPQGRHE